MEHLWLKWVGQLWQSQLVLLRGYAQKMVTFKGYQDTLSSPQVSVPLSSQPVAYYRKGGTSLVPWLLVGREKESLLSTVHACM